jgi:hypothetical protein
MKAVSFCEVQPAPRMMEENYALVKEDGKWMLTLARGQCRTGGYDIRLSAVVMDEGVLKVTVDFVNPAPKSFVMMVITFPVRKYELLLKEEPERVEVTLGTSKVLAQFDL